MVAFKDNTHKQTTAEELVENIKETITEKTNRTSLLKVGVLCVFIASAIVGTTFGILYAVTWVLAYLWNVGVYPLGAPAVTWWQVMAIWILAGILGQILKKFFKS